MKLHVDVLVSGALGAVRMDTIETAVFALRKRTKVDGTIDRELVDVEAYIPARRKDQILVPNGVPAYCWKNKRTLRTTARITGNGSALAPFFASGKNRWCVGGAVGHA